MILKCVWTLYFKFGMIERWERVFYLPDANIDIKSFVVTTIRNSLIESVSSSNYKSAGFEHQLREEEIKTITSFAIKYFKKFNFEEVSSILKEKT